MGKGVYQVSGRLFEKRALMDNCKFHVESPVTFTGDFCLWGWGRQRVLSTDRSPALHKTQCGASVA